LQEILFWVLQTWSLDESGRRRRGENKMSFKAWTQNGFVFDYFFIHKSKPKWRRFLFLLTRHLRNGSNNTTTEEITPSESMKELTKMYKFRHKCYTKQECGYASAQSLSSGMNRRTWHKCGSEYAVFPSIRRKVWKWELITKRHTF